ncbi:MAG: sensor histidine kinase [Proteobacteria bacterium]|nr:sensor histidine kinase [Pseudomonadota bacterium]
MKHPNLKARMIMLLGLMALVQTGLIGYFALQYLTRSLDDQIGQRAMHVAKTIATMPEIVKAVRRSDSTFLIPLAAKLAQKNDALFIVIGDKQGIRLAHPNPEKIGHSMQDDDGDDNAPALIHGKGYISKALGSLGLSMRGKAPILSGQDNQVVGVVSVGYLLDTVSTTISRYRATLLFVILIAFIISVLIAIWAANHFKRAIFGLEPEQIAVLFEERNATIEAVREGIIAVNAKGNIVTINQAAIDTLKLNNELNVVGKNIQDVLPDSELMTVIKSGQAQYDQDTWINQLEVIVNRIPIIQNDQVTGVVASFRRKDDLEKITRKLNDLEQYTDTLRSQAHEYSNKLHTIAGLIQLDARQEALALIGQESEDHQALIELLLKAVSDPTLAACFLGKFSRAKEMGLKLIIDPDSHMAELPPSFPKEHLMTIIANLVDNAFEATLQARGRGGEIRVSMTDLGNDLVFEFEDQGSGISLDEAENMFEKGVSSKKGDEHGFGLHIVKKLTRQLSGEITINPSDQGGSIITLYLPKNSITQEVAPA